ncbi:MAG TPA: hypothetical protein VKR54_02475 [Candidatus Babeliales bacterium]|nr:hypothetical protein [Candidatus Babeliales bacterium]
MKFFKNVLIIVALFATNSACAKTIAPRGGKAAAQPRVTNPTPTRGTTKQQPTAQPSPYAEILATLKATTPSAQDYETLQNMNDAINAQLLSLQ